MTEENTSQRHDPKAGSRRCTAIVNNVIPDGALCAPIRNLAGLKKIPGSPLTRRPGMMEESASQRHDTKAGSRRYTAVVNNVIPDRRALRADPESRGIPGSPLHGAPE